MDENNGRRGNGRRAGHFAPQPQINYCTKKGKKRNEAIRPCYRLREFGRADSDSSCPGDVPRQVNRMATTRWRPLLARLNQARLLGLQETFSFPSSSLPSPSSGEIASPLVVDCCTKRHEEGGRGQSPARRALRVACIPPGFARAQLC